MRQLEKIHLDSFYHIYNRGINGANLFYSEKNYSYFLELYKKYINPVADTYAWCLLKNHFHFLVRIKSEKQIVEHYAIDFERALKKPSQQFSNFFNSYVQAINKAENRHGSLLEKPFKRKYIKDETYLKNLIIYIHKNPIQHGFVKNVLDYKWNSYISLISDKKTLIERQYVIDYFETKENFIKTHKQKIDIISIEKWLKI